MRNRSLILLLMLCAGVACQKSESTTAATETTATTATSATTASATPQTSTTTTGTVPPDTWVDNLVIDLGTEAGPDGAVPPGKGSHEFKPGQSVVVSIEASSAPANTAVKLVWFGPNDSKLGEETKTTAAGQKYLTFTRTDTQKWAKGDYRIEIWLGDKDAGAETFKVS
jgi:hypothetical protein